MMGKLLILTLITIVTLGNMAKVGVFAFKWKSSSLFPNGTIVQSNTGDNVTLPWVFDMTSPGTVSIEWIKTSEVADQQTPLTVALYSGEGFLQLDKDRDLEFVPNAGITLINVTLADTGYYTVEVFVRTELQLYNQGAFLQVLDVPVTTSDELHAFILPEKVYNLTTGRWHVQLGCRLPITRGQSSLPVIWTTPSNRTVISTSYNNSNNIFILELPLPMEEGDYSCSLNRSVPAVKYLSTLSNARCAAIVSVNGVNTRLSDLEGSVERLWEETADLNGSLCSLTDIVQQLQTKDKKCDDVIVNLNQTTKNINSFLQNLQTKNENMTNKINCLEGITTDAQMKYDSMSAMLLNNFDNLTDVIQSNNDNITAIVQRNNGNITAIVQSKFDNITAMVQRNNDNIAAMVQIKFDNITAIVQVKFDNITALVERNNDSITAMFQSKFDNITSMVQRNNYNITPMVQSKFDNITSMVQSKFDNITSMVQRNNDNLTAMVQSKFDNITAMVQSKFDYVNAIVLQLQSGLIQLLGMDYVQRPASCVDVQKYDNVSGVHTLIMNDNRPVKVYCDQSTDNGGWTVIQRRQDGSVDFYRNWEQYETGFGDLNGEFWIGLANLYYLTTNKNSTLRVDLTDFDGSTAYAMYNTFSISGAQDYYQLNIGGYTGTAGDSMAYHNKMNFTTFDRDHDNSGGNCAQVWHGAWWYDYCHQSNLNGLYKSEGTPYNSDGVNWHFYKSDWRSFKRVEMKIKQ